MLFAVTWENIDTSEEGVRRLTDVFQAWKPAEGAEFKGFFNYADSGGGLAIIEVDSAATMARLTGPFLPWLTFTARPIIPVEESVAIGHEAIAFRDSVD